MQLKHSFRQKRSEIRVALYAELSLMNKVTETFQEDGKKEKNSE